MKIFYILFVVASQSLLAQSYEQSLKLCLANFHEGLGKFNKENAASEVERRYLVLNDCMRGKKFPPFTLHTYDKTKYSSKENEGKVVLLNFWVSKSVNSVAIIPILNELVNEYQGKDFVILSFVTDNTDVVTAFLKEHPVKYRVFDKTKELINHHFSTVLGYPTNIFLNKKGEVVEYRVGSGLSSGDIQKMKSDFKQIIDAELEK